MTRAWRFLPAAVSFILFLLMLYLMSTASNSHASAALTTLDTNSRFQNSVGGLLYWSQEISASHRTVLLQWQEIPKPSNSLYIPLVMRQVGANSGSQMSRTPEVPAYTIYRRPMGSTSWQMVGTSTPAQTPAEMVSLMGRDLTDQLAWDLREEGGSEPLSDQHLHEVLLSNEPRVQFASESFYQVDLVRGLAYLDRFAPLSQQLEYYVASPRYGNYRPIIVRDDASLPAPTGLVEVFPGPEELGKQNSSYPDDTEVRFRWDFYQKWREWDGSISLYWDTPSTDPSGGGGREDSEDTIGIRGYNVYRAEKDSSIWTIVNPESDCQTSSNQYCTIPVRVSALPDGVVTNDTYIFRDQLRDRFGNSADIYQEWDYKVCVVDLLGAEACSDRITAYGRDLDPPTAVSGVQVDKPDGGPIQLSWIYSDTSEVSGPVRFYVTRHMTLTTPADQWQPVYPQGAAVPYQTADIQQPAYITITDTPGKGQPYWYQIQVRDGAGNFSTFGAPLMGALYPRTAPSINKIPYDEVNCQNNPLPVSLNGLDGTIRLVSLYRGFTGSGPWSLVERLPVVNGMVEIDDDYLPPSPTVVYYAMEAVDDYGNVSPPIYYCTRLEPGEVPPPPPVYTDLVEEGGDWWIPYDWTAEADTVQITITEPGASGTSSTTVSTSGSPYMDQVNLGAWIETTVSGENSVGLGEGTAIWMHPTNNYLDTKRQMTHLGDINNMVWSEDDSGNLVVRIDLTGDCDQCRSLPLVAAFRRSVNTSWLQVTPVQEIPRPSTDAPWVITDTTDLSPNELYEYTVLAISPDSYEVLGFWGTNKITPLITDQAPIALDTPLLKETLWPPTCPYDGFRPSTAGLPATINLANGWSLRVHYYFVGSSACAPVTALDPSHLYGDGLLSNGVTDWMIEFADIGLDTGTGNLTSGRIDRFVDVVIDEVDRLPTQIGRMEFTPGTVRAEVSLTLPEHVNLIHPDQGRSNEIDFVAENVQTDFTFSTYPTGELLMVDENLPWIILYPQGALRVNKVGAYNTRYTAETIDRFRYSAPAIVHPAVPDNNLAFMRPQYTSQNAVFDREGLSGDFTSAAPVNYSTSLPAAVVIEAAGALLTIDQGNILSGTLSNALARLDYLGQDTVKDYMLYGGRCSPGDPELKYVRCYQDLKTLPPSYQEMLMAPFDEDITIGAGGVMSPVVALDTFPNWTRYEVETNKGTLFVAAAMVSGTPTSWAPMPVENAWSQLPHPEWLGDLDPGLNINVLDDPASYSCFTPAEFSWSVTDLYIRRGGVSEYFYTGEDLPGDRVNDKGYIEQVFHVELSLLDNIEEPVDYRTNLRLPYPSEVTYPLTTLAIDPEDHCPQSGEITTLTNVIHRYWSFEESPNSWAYLSNLAKYGNDTASLEEIFALQGTAVINGLSLQSTSQAGVTVERSLWSEWFPNGDAGDLRLLTSDLPVDGYRVSGIKYNLSDVKLSRYYSAIMDESSLPDTLGIDLSANASELPLELLDGNGALTAGSLKDCSLDEIDGCGFVLLDGDGSVDYFGELVRPAGSSRQPSAIPIDDIVGALPIVTNEVISNAIQMVVESPELHWIWPAANLLVNNELQKYNIPVKFMGNTLGGALVGILADTSILPGSLPEVIKADLAAVVVVDWNDQRGYKDQIGIFAGYTASQAAFRALAMNRPQKPRAGILPFDLWEDVESDIARWAVDFGYTLDPGPDNEEDDPVDLAKLIWEEGWCRTWDPDPDDPERECTDRITDLAEIYDILEPMLMDMNGAEAYGPLAVTSGEMLNDARIRLSNGAGLVIFSPVGVNDLRFETFQFGTRLVMASDSYLRDNNLVADWLHFDMTRDGQYIFQGTNLDTIIVGEFGIRSDILLVIDTTPGSEHVEGGVETDTIEVPYLFKARAAGVIGAGFYNGEQAGFIGLRGEAETDDLYGIENEMSLSIMAGMLPTESLVIGEFGFGDVLDKFGGEYVQDSPAPFTGAYFALAGQVPLIEGTCLLQAGGGGEIRLWYFQADNGQDKYGGQLEAQVSATIACLLSGRGEVALGFERLLVSEPVSPPPGEDSNWGPLPRYCDDPGSCFAYTGSVWFAVGVGYCSPEHWDSWSGTRGNWWGDDWCYTFGAMLGLSYLTPAPAGEDLWKVDVDMKFE